MKLSPRSSCLAPLAALVLVAAAAPSALAAEPAAPSSGFMLGVSVDVAAPQLAVFYQTPQLQPGAAVGVSAGYRWRFLYVGAAYQHAVFGGGTYANEGTVETATGARSDYVGVDIVTLSSPDARVAFLTHQSAGYRVLTTDTYIDSPPVSTFSKGGWDARIFGIGVQIKANDWLRIVPEASLSVGAATAVASLGVTTYFDFAGATGGTSRSARAAKRD